MARGERQAGPEMASRAETWILELAEPGAVPLERSGFTARICGQLENNIVPTSRTNP